MANAPRHAAATPAVGVRALRALLALLVMLVSVVGFASTATATDGPNPGTIKIDEESFDSDDGNSNNPKPVGCTFAIDFYNFPSDTPTATISFENKSPGRGTNSDVTEADLTGPREVTFGTLDDPANEKEYTTATYTVVPDGGLVALPNDSILLKVTVTLKGDGNFVKHKVLKVECLPVTPPEDTVPDLAITKGGPATATVGMVGSYTLGVKNEGTQTVTEPIVVTDTLPAGVTPTAASGSGFVCTVVGQLVTCTSEGDLAPGDSTAPITIAVTFGSGALPSVVNTAVVDAVTGETVLDNNEDTHTTTVTVPVIPPSGTAFDLAVDKAGPATAVAGSSISYVINVRNNGPDASPGFVVTDQLSAGQVATAVNAGSDYVCGISADQRTVTCTRAAGLAAGETASAITVTVTAPATAGAISDTASVPVLTGDTNAGNNSDTVTTTTTIPVQTTVIIVGPPTGLLPTGPTGPTGPEGPAPEDITGATPDQPATLPVPALPAPAVPVTGLPIPELPTQAVPVQGVVGPQAATLPAAVSVGTAQPQALPFTGSAVDRILAAGMTLLLLGAGALLLGLRSPRGAHA